MSKFGGGTWRISFESSPSPRMRAAIPHCFNIDMSIDVEKALAIVLLNVGPTGGLAVTSLQSFCST